MGAIAWLRALVARPSPKVLPPPVGGVTFEAAQAHYTAALRARSITGKTVENKLAAFNYLQPIFQGREIEGIRPFEIARLIRQIHDDGMHVTSRHVLSTSRDFFNEALLQGWVDINPALHVKRLPAPVRRQRLTLAQFLAIADYGRQHFPPWFYVCMRLALVTGQRRSDLIRLRFADVRDGHLFVEQYKTGARVAIPLDLRLDALGCSVGEVIEEARAYGPDDSDFLLRTAARPARCLSAQSLSNRFWVARNAVCPHTGPGEPPTFHEVRSLSERLYRAQGIDTQTLLGHKHQRMTDKYNDERGLNAGCWKYLELPKMPP